MEKDFNLNQSDENYKKAEEITNKLLGSKYFINSRIIGGMSNYTYVISDGTHFFTLRFPMDNSEYFINRDDEKIGIDIFQTLNLTSKTIYFDTKTGIKISQYIEGTSLNKLNNLHYHEVANLLYKLHNAKIDTNISYNPFNRLEKYQSYIKNSDYYSEKYINIKNKLLKYKSYLNSQEQVFCHNDSQPSNFICMDDNIYIVDFEFVGKNDYIYDIACYGNDNFNDAIELLKEYISFFETKITENEYNDLLKRLYLWKAFQALQWYLVAAFKEILGMSEALKIDFEKVAYMYLELCDGYLDDVIRNF